MLISRDQFKHFVNKLACCYKEQEMFHTDMRKYFDAPACNYLQSAIDALEELLVTVCGCGDEDDIFFWWVHEVDKDNRWLTVQDTQSGNHREFDVLTPDGLYEYLCYMYGSEKQEVS